MDEVKLRSQRGPRSANPDEGINVCPHLGLATDPFIHIAEPSTEHRCYLWMQRDRIDQAHQQRFCLTAAYTSCPWLAVNRQSSTTDGPETHWQQLRDTLRERFDDLERATMRSSWPKAVLALLVFLVEVSILCGREVRRVAGPTARRALVEARRLWQWYLETYHPIVAQWARSRFDYVLYWFTSRLHSGASRPAWTPDATARADTVATAFPPVEAARRAAPEPAALASEILAEGIDARRGKPRRKKDLADGGGTLEPWLVRWECNYCSESNPSGIVLCQRCGRLSVAVDEELRNQRQLAVLDGLKAMQVGDEDRAYRHFVRATADNADNVLAWQRRMRTAPGMSDVVLCLENLVRLNPSDTRLVSELTVARARAAAEAALRAAAAKAKQVKPKPAVRQPTVLSRFVGFLRRLCLELASIPCFALGLLWLGQPFRDILDMLGLGSLKVFVPVFHLPPIMVRVPPGLSSDVIPSSFDAGGLILAAVAIWYLRLAFRAADGVKGSRIGAVASGLIALAALPLIVAGGAPFAQASILLLVLALIGQSRPADFGFRRGVQWGTS